MSEVLSELQQLCERWVHERRLLAGVQVFVACQGDIVLDAAFGMTHREEPMTSSHMHPSWCWTKPLLALAVAMVCEEQGLPLQTRVSSLLKPSPVIVRGDTTVADLLNHGAGLREPLMIGVRLCPTEQRDALLINADNGGSSSYVYSEIAAGVVGEALVLALAGQSARNFIRERILRPLSLDDDVILSVDDLCRDRRERLRVPVGGLPAQAVPMLYELLPVALLDVGPASGGFTNAAGMGRLFVAISLALSRRQEVAGLPSPAMLDEMISTRRGLQPDELLRTTLDFSCGFLVGLTDHRICSGSSTRAFAATGGVANAATVADPERDVVVSLYSNGSTLNMTEDWTEVRRQVIDLALCAAYE